MILNLNLKFLIVLSLFFILRVWSFSSSPFCFEFIWFSRFSFLLLRFCLLIYLLYLGLYDHYIHFFNFGDQYQSLTLKTLNLTYYKCSMSTFFYAVRLSFTFFRSSRNNISLFYLKFCLNNHNLCDLLFPLKKVLLSDWNWQHDLLYQSFIYFVFRRSNIPLFYFFSVSI